MKLMYNGAKCAVTCWPASRERLKNGGVIPPGPALSATCLMTSRHIDPPAAVFLASDAAAMVTGVEYQVTGGDNAKDI